MAIHPPEGAAPRDPTGRRMERVGVDAEVTLRRSAALSYRVRVFDASALGCRLEFVERPQLHERVWVKFDRLDPIEGVVCWTEGSCAGIAFARPIHQAVFDALAARLG